MRNQQLDSIDSDEMLSSEIKNMLRRKEASRSSEDSFFESALEIPREQPSLVETASANRGLEAIILRFGRPSLLVKGGTFEVPPSDTWKARLYPTKTGLDRAIASVGRVELINHQMAWAGTAWMIAEDIVVTNRHVADLFSQREGNGFSFRHNPFGKPFGAKIDFREEHIQTDVLELDVERILYVADNRDGFPDLAFLKLKKNGSGLLPQPIPLFDADLELGQMVAVVGYPAYDERNDVADMSRIFENIYGVKRFAPGEITAVSDGSFTHDCSTLGGNSGSAIVDVLTGNAVGLHFAGEFLRANFAVSSKVLRKYLDDFSGVTVSMGTVPLPIVPGDGDEASQPTIIELSDRKGYDEMFLGEDFLVAMPEIADEFRSKIATPEGGDGDPALKYTNYSVVMNTERRLAFFTATNIDGSVIKRIKRGNDRWFFDPRIPRSAQVGNELYAKNDLDRGHLTRRLDPAWGPQHKLAEEDTFFFTNCTPQHHLFNTRTWLELEDHLLESSETHGFRASVFTGPVFGSNDRPYSFKIKGDGTDLILLPLQYWKVVVMINADTRTLSSTAYTISQKDLITNMEFVFGQFKTYQLPIKMIESMTGIDFGDLKNFDPLKNFEGHAVRELSAFSDIVL